MSLAQRTMQRWYGTGPRPWLLRPLGWLYRGVAAARAWMYRRGWLHSVRLPVPVVVVGNITLGGTGKTPLVIALVEHFRARGWRPGVVSRGYGGSEQGPYLLPERPDPARCGDEPSLIRRQTGAPVAIGRRRPEAAQLLVDAGADLVIADDGLQHYRLQRDVEICVMDGRRRLGNGLVLPCGPLREPPARLRRVDYCVLNGGTARTGEVPMVLENAPLQPLGEATATPRTLRDFQGRRVHAVAGIGHPARFFDSLRAHGIEVVEHAFDDHHVFAPADLAFGDTLPVLMTTKDAVKCADFAPPGTWSVPVRARLPDDFLVDLEARLVTARQKNTAP